MVSDVRIIQSYIQKTVLTYVMLIIILCTICIAAIIHTYICSMCVLTFIRFSDVIQTCNVQIHCSILKINKTTYVHRHVHDICTFTIDIIILTMQVRIGELHMYIHTYYIRTQMHKRIHIREELYTCTLYIPRPDMYVRTYVSKLKR